MTITRFCNKYLFKKFQTLWGPLCEPLGPSGAPKAWEHRHTCDLHNPCHQACLVSRWQNLVSDHPQKYPDLDTKYPSYPHWTWCGVRWRDMACGDVIWRGVEGDTRSALTWCGVRWRVVAWRGVWIGLLFYVAQFKLERSDLRSHTKIMTVSRNVLW